MNAQAIPPTVLLIIIAFYQQLINSILMGSYNRFEFFDFGILLQDFFIKLFHNFIFQLI